MKPNQTITNPILGETLTLLVSENSNNGASTKYEIFMPGHGQGPYVHFHTDFIEIFTVKKGILDFYLGKERKHIPLLTGQTITANKRQLHSFLNNHDESVIFTVEAIPAGGFINAFQLACGVANAGRAGNDGFPANLLEKLYFIKLTRGFLSKIPVIVQKAAFMLATFLLFVMGRKKYLDKYLD